MSARKHKDYKIEKDRLKYTKDYIEKTIDATDYYKNTYKGNIKEAMENLDHLDSSQSYINILVNTKFLEIAERNFDHLIRYKDKPYFARIDFKEDGKENIDKVYIGKISLSRAEDDIPLVVDWRSPIANLYYEGRLGENTYETETDTIKGEMYLKRQYSIEKGDLKDIMDIDITTNDAFLQASLEAGADSRLKDIATTIQSEQNRVIRAEMNKPLIVQGVAGSGKTTIALHRIAYFMYRYENVFIPENFLIVAPNNLFMTYISEVLPELGVERVKQVTLVDFFKSLIKDHVTIHKGEDKLSIISSLDREKEAKEIFTVSKFKGSFLLGKHIESRMRSIAKSILPNEDFKIYGKVLVPKERIEEVFVEELSYMPLEKRPKELQKILKNKLKSEKERLLQALENKYERRLLDIRTSTLEEKERRETYKSAMYERDEKFKEAENLLKTLDKKYIKSIKMPNAIDVYKSIMTLENLKTILHGKEYMDFSLDNEKIQIIAKHTLGLLSHGLIEREDLAPLAYIRHFISGSNHKYDIKSVVIDESQDYSLLELYVLKKILNTEMFTLFGDIAQGIHSYRSLENWDALYGAVFDRENSGYTILKQSYRTTVEIMEFANKIIKKSDIKDLILANPVIRHGDKPQMKGFEDKKDLVQIIKRKIDEEKSKAYKSIALITKSYKDAEILYKLLSKEIPERILLKENQNYSAGVMIVPSNIAKGLEFDSVIIVNIDEEYTLEPINIKLLYVAATRAMHSLTIVMENTKLEKLKKDFEI